MKKMKVFALCAVLVIAMTLSACGKQTVAVAPTPDPTPVTEPVVTEPVVEPEVEPEEPKQDLSILRTTEELAKNNQGPFLLRDGVFYTLRDNADKETPGVNYLPGSLQALEGVLFYESFFREQRLMAYGDVPVPIITEGDEVVVYDKEPPSSIQLCPAVLEGHYLFIRPAGMLVDMKTNKAYNIKSVELTIVDEEGNSYTKTDALPKDGKYTISWYQGTEYKEIVIDLLCPVYWYDRSSPKFELSAELTKNGYARYDFSGVTSGLYALYYKGMEFIIEIP